MTSEEIVSHLTETGPVIVLTNANQLQCRWTFWVISCSVDIIEIENTANPIKVGSLLLFPPQKITTANQLQCRWKSISIFVLFFFSEDKLYDIFRKCSPASSISQYILLSIPCYILLNSITFCYIFLYPGNAVQPALYPDMSFYIYTLLYPAKFYYILLYLSISRKCSPASSISCYPSCFSSSSSYQVNLNC